MGQYRPVLLSTILLAVFVIITSLVFLNIIQNFDSWLTLVINNTYLGNIITASMILFTEYGREYFWVAILGVMLIFGKRETKLLAFELAILFAVGVLVGEALKFAIHRSRPYEALAGIVGRIPMDLDSSYPSGHAIIVSIGAFFSLKKFRVKTVSLLLTIEAVIVCYSRVYLGVHYLLDVVSGFILAAAIVSLGMFIIERHLGYYLESLAYFSKKILGEGPVDL